MYRTFFAFLKCTIQGGPKVDVLLIAFLYLWLKFWEGVDKYCIVPVRKLFYFHHWRKLILSRFQILPNFTSLLLYSRIITLLCKVTSPSFTNWLFSVHNAQLSHRQLFWLLCCLLCALRFPRFICHAKNKQLVRTSTAFENFLVELIKNVVVSWNHLYFVFCFIVCRNQPIYHLRKFFSSMRLRWHICHVINDKCRSIFSETSWRNNKCVAKA